MSTLRGLYAVTPDWPDTGRLTAAVRLALQGGARLVQYRNKSASAALRREQAAALLPLCRRQGVPLIVNDHLELALQLDADGVHLGAADDSLEMARRRLPPGKLLGASCYRDLEAALRAQSLGADYVAFGSFFPSTTKPDAVRAPVDLLQQARRTLTLLPIAAIGGITPGNAGALIDAGASLLAVISALFDVADTAGAARRLTQLFEAAEDHAPQPQ